MTDQSHPLLCPELAHLVHTSDCPVVCSDGLAQLAGERVGLVSEPGLDLSSARAVGGLPELGVDQQVWCSIVSADIKLPGGSDVQGPQSARADARRAPRRRGETADHTGA